MKPQLSLQLTKGSTPGILLIHLLVYSIILISIHGCSEPENLSAPHPNIPPDTKLANVPLNDPNGENPLFALITLNWIGSDGDGYVTAFKYRWSYVEHGVTKYRDWITIPAIDSTGRPVPGSNSRSFVFESQQELNPHLFEIAAIDDAGEADPTPASKWLWTSHALPPETQFKSVPDSHATVFMIDHVTDTWRGIKFVFNGTDEDGEVVDFSWKVDDGDWSEWQLSAEAIVLAKHLSPPLNGRHVFYVKARDNTNIDDQTPASWPFQVLIPTWTRQMLIIDNTRDGTGTIGSPTDVQVDSFYSSIIRQTNRTDFDHWDVKKQPYPRRQDLADYRIILWHSDFYIVDLQSRPNAAFMETIQDYLNVGGRLIMSGWKFTLLSSTEAPVDSFIYQYAHVQFTMEATSNKDFIGAIGMAGYPDVAIDGTKLIPIWNGAIDRVLLVTPRGFAEPIYQFNSPNGASSFQGRTVAVRYLGITYQVVFLGYPLYFLNRDDARAVIDRVMLDFNE